MKKRRENGKWAAHIAFLSMLLLGWAWGRAAWADANVQWAWMKGSNTTFQSGMYGTPGTPTAGNTPGARKEATAWTDGSGTLWLFGGTGLNDTIYSGRLNDLWKYDPAVGNWVWMKGASAQTQAGTYGTLGTGAEANTPGGRLNAAAWTDVSGVLWLFGGYGQDGAGNYGPLNDLWKYDPASGNWTWVKGPSTYGHYGVYGMLGTAAEANTPGGRDFTVSWIDSSGVLWLFGGFGYDRLGSYGRLNDLWKYTPATGNWTWMKGSDLANENGTSGIRGTADAANTPGGREGAISWIDPSGVLWLFGGYGVDGGGSLGELNDLWKYDRSTDNWTWMKGAMSFGQAGIYGALGTEAADNTPGARHSGVSFVDSWGHLWLFGGRGTDAAGNVDNLNDLWKYDRSSGNWVWVKGADTIAQNGVYGTFGTVDAANMPGARRYAASWTDSSGALWLFGGEAYPAAGDRNICNDLWRGTILPDAIAPAGTVMINNNRTVTNSAKVTLSLTWADDGGSGVVRMKFSNDGLTWTAWEPLAATKSWTLPAGEGYHTVRAMFRDAAGNNSIVYNDYIHVDTIPPTGSIIINNGDLSTKNRVVSLGLTWSDGTGSGVTRMRFSINGATWSVWEPQKTPKSYTLPATPQYYTVRVQYLDAGNNRSSVYSDYIKLVAP